MKKPYIKLLKALTAMGVATFLAACGGGAGGTGAGSAIATSGTGTGTTPSVPTASAIEIQSSKLELGTGASETALITVIVKNTSNQAVADVAVNISADNGTLVVNEVKTDAKGQVTATLNPGASKSNRTINIMATATGVSGALSAKTALQVTGTKISISSPTSAGIGAPVTLGARLQDSLGNGLRDTAINSSSNLNNLNNKTCVPVNCLTDSSGNVSITYTPTVGGTENIVFSALGATAAQSISIATDSLTISVPDDANQLAKEYLISSTKTVTFFLSRNNAPLVGQTINISSTGGTFTPAAVVTNASGVATAQLNISNSVGLREISASHAISGGVSNKFSFSTVSRNASILTLNPSPAVLGVNSANSTVQQSILTANVRDSTLNSNPVKNIIVTFNIVNSASAGGRLTTASAVTDADGNATTTYIAGTTQSGNSGVTISATINTLQNISKTSTASLSVTQQALYINLAFGNEVVLIANNTLMKQNFSVIVTDATGNPSSGSNVAVALQPIEYYKGLMVPTAGGWAPAGYTTSTEILNANGGSFVPPQYSVAVFPVTVCANEDKNFDSIIQGTEDINGDGILWPGVVPTVKFLNGTTAGLTGVTNAQGYAEFEMNIPRNHALWSKYKVVVSTQTASGGAQGVSSTLYKLPAFAADLTTTSVTPPNLYSPFGQATVCTDKN